MTRMLAALRGKYKIPSRNITATGVEQTPFLTKLVGAFLDAEDNAPHDSGPDVESHAADDEMSKVPEAHSDAGDLGDLDQTGKVRESTPLGSDARKDAAR